MPPETPPSRVKKAWRRPGMAESSGDSSDHGAAASASGFASVSSWNPATSSRWGSEIAEHLEHRSHAAAAAADQALQRARNVLGNLVGGFRHQGHRAGLDAEPLEEIALRHRAVHPRAEILGGAHQRLEIDMRGDVGLTRILQRIGEAVAGDGLKGIAGVAAQMAVVDDQRRAILVAHPALRSS